MMKRILTMAAAGILFGILGTMPAKAVVLLSNLTSAEHGTFGGFPDSADDFMTGNTGLNITSIDIKWALGNGGTNNRAGIFTDSGGLPSGTQVGGWFTSAAATANAVINYVGNAVLSANTIYWMVVDILDSSQVGYSFTQVVTADPSTLGATIIGPTPGSAYGNIQTVSWTDDPANLLYALNGRATGVSEPFTLAIFGLGLAGLGLMRRRKRVAA